ncbi:ChaN family lipoprotein [Lyngbya aestuarii]|uniref:ChaN family lipoprotein n=1 Tax=Lyngbya aestuarii TaxID=118322 RepID=UPI00403D9AB4
MKIPKIAKLFACSLGIFLLCTAPTGAENTLTSVQPEQQQLTQQKILKELIKADVVYLGETHSSAADHQAQLAIMQALYQENPKIAIAMEMFQRPYQDILDQYLAGKITEAQLIEQTEYEQRWGFPWEYYAPLVRFAKANQLPVLALNAPTEVTRQVARNGIESLTKEERQYIPPLSEIRTDNAEYRQMVQKLYEQHHQAGQGNSSSLEGFFTTQVLWDETMAQAIAQFLETNPDYQVVVLAGLGHLVYSYGIPSRVARRLENRQLLQSTVLLGVSEAEVKASFPTPNTRSQNKVADYFWQHF